MRITFPLETRLHCKLTAFRLLPGLALKCQSGQVRSISYDASTIPTQSWPKSPIPKLICRKNCLKCPYLFSLIVEKAFSFLVRHKPCQFLRAFFSLVWEKAKDTIKFNDFRFLEQWPSNISQEKGWPIAIAANVH